MLEHLLQYARDGKDDDRIELVDTEAEVREVAALLDAPGVEVVICGELPEIRTARAPLHQVFHNLIGNAINHNDSGVGRIEIRARQRLPGLAPTQDLERFDTKLEVRVEEPTPGPPGPTRTEQDEEKRGVEGHRGAEFVSFLSLVTVPLALLARLAINNAKQALSASPNRRAYTLRAADLVQAGLQVSN